mmetsp:Transcript_11213/g.25888  ORF Transcript_11213/g.25888 Transcript_11213/m.25888 type:complete len:222 (+) Transcript_11213:986-1651(+)
MRLLRDICGRQFLNVVPLDCHGRRHVVNEHNQPLALLIIRQGFTFLPVHHGLRNQLHQLYPPAHTLSRASSRRRRLWGWIARRWARIPRCSRRFLWGRLQRSLVGCLRRQLNLDGFPRPHAIWHSDFENTAPSRFYRERIARDQTCRNLHEHGLSLRWRRLLRRLCRLIDRQVHLKQIARDQPIWDSQCELLLAHSDTHRIATLQPIGHSDLHEHHRAAGR